MSSGIYKAPRGSSSPVLGRTLPSLLEEAARINPSPKALNQLEGEQWRSFSTQEVLAWSAETALGLLEVGLVRQDRVCLFMESDVYFCIADMGCLIAGIIDVPIYLTHTPETVSYVMGHAQARAVVVSTPAILERVIPSLQESETIRKVILAMETGEALPELPSGIELHTLDQVREMGKERLRKKPGTQEQLMSEIDPRDVATVIYTSGTTGDPKGVMLTHQNISSNVMAAFGENENVHRGEEVILSFLPLTHVFNRMLHYGNLNYGSEVYFTEADRISEHLRSIQPTGFATVPHLLEKVYERIVVKGALLSGIQKRTFDWAFGLAKKYDLTRRRGPLYWGQLRLADRLVYRKWREALGGRVRGIICGGAALSAELVNFFAAAGVAILQGYGLTETSPVVCYNRVKGNRPGTVGVPLPGVEITIGEDGEILTRGPHVMHGYYRDPRATRETIDDQGWLHTGDIGEIEKGGYLRITDRKKSLFKLSTGKFVTPQPLENRLKAETLVREAVVVGPEHKYCTAIIRPEPNTLRIFAKLNGLDPETPWTELIRHEKVLSRFEEIVLTANQGVPHWSQIQYFVLVDEDFTIENGLLTPTLKIRRNKVYEHFADLIQEMYRQGELHQEESGRMALTLTVSPQQA